MPAARLHSPSRAAHLPCDAAIVGGVHPPCVGVGSHDGLIGWRAWAPIKFSIHAGRDEAPVITSPVLEVIVGHPQQRGHPLDVIVGLADVLGPRGGVHQALLPALQTKGWLVTAPLSDEDGWWGVEQPSFQEQECETEGVHLSLHAAPHMAAGAHDALDFGS